MSECNIFDADFSNQIPVLPVV